MYIKSTQIFGEVDDVVIVGRSIVELKEIMKRLMKATQVMELNMQKTNNVKITKIQLIIKF